ncbi:hypothetical protein SNEBB_000183 [Seison nebaliae]|nr:hypothetical protein SNEBB_000183 [Seison nebaliae]
MEEVTNLIEEKAKKFNLTSKQTKKIISTILKNELTVDYLKYVNGEPFEEEKKKLEENLEKNKFLQELDGMCSRLIETNNDNESGKFHHFLGPVTRKRCKEVQMMTKNRMKRRKNFNSVTDEEDDDDESYIPSTDDNLSVTSEETTTTTTTEGEDEESEEKRENQLHQYETRANIELKGKSIFELESQLYENPVDFESTITPYNLYGNQLKDFDLTFTPNQQSSLMTNENFNLFNFDENNQFNFPQLNDDHNNNNNLFHDNDDRDYLTFLNDTYCQTEENSFEPSTTINDNEQCDLNTNFLREEFFDTDYLPGDFQIPSSGDLLPEDNPFKHFKPNDIDDDDNNDEETKIGEFGIDLDDDEDERRFNNSAKISKKEIKNLYDDWHDMMNNDKKFSTPLKSLCLNPPNDSEEDDEDTEKKKIKKGQNISFSIPVDNLAKKNRNRIDRSIHPKTFPIQFNEKHLQTLIKQMKQYVQLLTQTYLLSFTIPSTMVSTSSIIKNLQKINNLSSDDQISLSFFRRLTCENQPDQIKDCTSLNDEFNMELRSMFYEMNKLISQSSLSDKLTCFKMAEVLFFSDINSLRQSIHLDIFLHRSHICRNDDRIILELTKPSQDELINEVSDEILENYVKFYEKCGIRLMKDDLYSCKKEGRTIGFPLSPLLRLFFSHSIIFSHISLLPKYSYLHWTYKRQYPVYSKTYNKFEDQLLLSTYDQCKKYDMSDRMILEHFERNLLPYRHQKAAGNRLRFLLDKKSHPNEKKEKKIKELFFRDNVQLPIIIKRKFLRLYYQDERYWKNETVDSLTKLKEFIELYKPYIISSENESEEYLEDLKSISNFFINDCDWLRIVQYSPKVHRSADIAHYQLKLMFHNFVDQFVNIVRKKCSYNQLQMNWNDINKLKISDKYVTDLTMMEKPAERKIEKLKKNKEILTEMKKIEKTENGGKKEEEELANCLVQEKENAVKNLTETFKNIKKSTKENEKTTTLLHNIKLPNEKKMKNELKRLKKKRGRRTLDEHYKKFQIEQFLKTKEKESEVILSIPQNDGINFDSDTTIIVEDLEGGKRKTRNKFHFDCYVKKVPTVELNLKIKRNCKKKRIQRKISKEKSINFIDSLPIYQLKLFLFSVKFLQQSIVNHDDILLLSSIKQLYFLIGTLRKGLISTKIFIKFLCDTIPFCRLNGIFHNRILVKRRRLSLELNCPLNLDGGLKEHFSKYVWEESIDFYIRRILKFLYRQFFLRSSLQINDEHKLKLFQNSIKDICQTFRWHINRKKQPLDSSKLLELFLQKYKKCLTRRGIVFLERNLKGLFGQSERNKKWRIVYDLKRFHKRTFDNEYNLLIDRRLHEKHVTGNGGTIIL